MFQSTNQVWRLIKFNKHAINLLSWNKHGISILWWVNYNISLTWIKAIWGWFPLLTSIPVRSQWGCYNLPRYYGGSISLVMLSELIIALSHFSVGGILGVFTHRSKPQFRSAPVSGSTTEWVAGGCWDDKIHRYGLDHARKFPAN